MDLYLLIINIKEVNNQNLQTSLMAQIT